MPKAPNPEPRSEPSDDEIARDARMLAAIVVEALRSPEARHPGQHETSAPPDPAELFRSAASKAAERATVLDARLPRTGAVLRVHLYPEQSHDPGAFERFATGVRRTLADLVARYGWSDGAAPEPPDRPDIHRNPTDMDR